jgi:hypothetical protein
VVSNWAGFRPKKTLENRSAEQGLSEMRHVALPPGQIGHKISAEFIFDK